MQVKKVTVADIEPLIEPNKGNVAVIARKLGVSRGTILNRCNESPTLAQALTDARESMLDNAESMLYKKVLEGSTVELLFFLKTQGRNRGYVERQEVTGKDGGSVTVTLQDWRQQTAASRKQAAAVVDDFANSVSDDPE